jgi:CelD/BcsL family acetyltransferase involved in cellulose biosynthesis
MSAGKPLRNHGSDPVLAHYSSEACQQYSIEPLRSTEGVPSLKEDWNRLSETSEEPNVFMTYDWFWAWNQCRAREYHRGLRRPEILVLKKDGVIAGIAPLIYRESSRFGFRVRMLESLASPADYYDVVVGNDPQGQIEAVTNYFAQTSDRWDFIDLRSLRETGNVKPLLARALSRTKFIYRIPPEERCPYLVIDAPWSVMATKLSRHARHHMRTQQKRLDLMRAEGLRVRIVENPQDETGLLGRLTALESQKRIRGGPMPPFLAKHPEVFQLLFDTLGRRGWMYIALMELSDHLLAWQLGFRCGKRLWDYSKAYDRSFSRLSPGTMLFPAVVDYGFSHGYREYDFLRDDEEPYKLRWSTASHETFRLQIWSRRLMRQAHLAWGAVHRLISSGE